MEGKKEKVPSSLMSESLGDGTSVAVPVPLLVRPWVWCYRRFYGGASSTPSKVSSAFPPYGFTLACSACFLALRWSLGVALRTFTDWPDDRGTDAIATAMTSMVHSSLLCPAAGVVLWSMPYRPSTPLSSSAGAEPEPEWYGDVVRALLEYCTGYMLYDGGYNSLFVPWFVRNAKVGTAGWCFIGHHIASAFYMVSVHVVGAGHQSVMIFMFFGEVTAPLFNARNALDIALRTGRLSSYTHTLSWATSWFPVVNYAYHAMYAWIRLPLGWCLESHITYDLCFTAVGRSRVPLPLSIVWQCLMWGVTLGSLPWCIDSANKTWEGIVLVASFFQGGTGAEL